ncbi:hypothetical protein GCM10011374_24010 [Kocuria dechangensis]|uniref:Uncharacterized protein n=1 Tax=Kocuria dechangensis TaxID=1176249 RepID=A0A917GXU5_9MICC|nr:hypothetical protein GCM10011374_24010 [Kocuria dechangensis]
MGDAYGIGIVECIIGLCQTECIRPGAFVNVLLKTTGDIDYATIPWRTGMETGACTPASATSPHRG